VLAFVEATGAIFEDRKLAERCWTHDLEALIRVAELEKVFGLDLSANVSLQQNWAVVKDWDETSRYRQKSQSEAEALFASITDKRTGCFDGSRTVGDR
jgi:hypothetical protein